MGKLKNSLNKKKSKGDLFGVLEINLWFILKEILQIITGLNKKLFALNFFLENFIIVQ